jgi:hypothetical protein
MATTTSTGTKRAPRARKAQTTRRAAARKATPEVDVKVDVRTKAPYRGAQLDPRTLAFASIGAGDLAFTTVREVSGKVMSVVRSPRGLQDVTDQLSIDMTKVVEMLASRGEKLVGSVQRSPYTKRAIDQTKVARSQVKAARTSVRKAVDTTTTAARQAAKTVS